MLDTSQELYKTYDTYSKIKDFKDLPKHVTDNLTFDLRDYQKEAIGRYLFYMNGDPEKKSPTQLLFNMATGSGKTIIMAALLLDLYKKGKRNFIFFVNSSNIIEKTRDNFINISSPKYLFTENIMIDGDKIAIREVNSFSDSDTAAINILLTTTQGLHTDLNNPHENRLTYEELIEQEIVLIGDEAHHNSAGLTKKEQDDNNSWETTVSNILRKVKDPMLFEFTATIDMEDASIRLKYLDKIIYKYDLKAFREDRFSKDVLIYSVDAEIESRELQAMIISQYRKKVALKNGVFLKPVIMLKSETKIKSEENYLNFIEFTKNLGTEQIASERLKASDIFKQAFDYFSVAKITDEDLVSELKEDFRKERLVIIDGNNVTPEKQQIVNSLEEKTNEYRAIFTVDMLKEGWDVLNLFDIVRLYDTRDGGGHGDTYKPGKTTMSEAQLIGRGARYYPFVLNGEEDERYLRKFDEDEDNEMRILEQLHYHSNNNVRYIAELKQTLDKTGITNFNNSIEHAMKLKDSFQKTTTYQTGVIFVNERISKLDAKAKQATLGLGILELPKLVAVELPTGLGREINIFEDDDIKTQSGIKKSQKLIKIGSNKDITPNVVRAAMNRNKAFHFDKLHKFMFNSIDAFISSLGSIEIEISGAVNEIDDLNQDQKLHIAIEVLHCVENNIDHEVGSYEGSAKFIPVLIKDAFRKSFRRKYTLSENRDSEGHPQYTSPTYALNLADRAWYAYEENYGTDEEKSLVKTLDEMVNELSKKWSDIYLLRNEKAVTIYDFDEGRAFEPDFILLANDKESGNVSWQIFIEPKGPQFIGGDGTFDTGKEGWKQKMLLEIEEKFNATTLKENSNYRVIGVPFYNKDRTKVEIIDELRARTNPKNV